MEMLLNYVEVTPMILDLIKDAQHRDSNIQRLTRRVKSNDMPGFNVDDSGVL